MDPFGYMLLRSLTLPDNKPEARIRLDPSLLRATSDGLHLHCEPPFRAAFSDPTSGRQFIFLAVDQINPRIIPTLKDEIRSIKPTKIIAELETDHRDLPKSLLEDMARDSLREGFSGLGDIALVATAESGVMASIVGGQSSLSQTFRELARSHSREELLAFSSVRAGLNLKRMGVFSGQWSSRFMAELKKSHSAFTIGDWSFARFEYWLRNNLNFSVYDIEESWIEPSLANGAIRLQKIASELESIRTPQLLRATEAVINSCTKSMMVYGSRIYSQFLPALKGAFGQPTVYCLHARNFEEQSDALNVIQDAP